MVWFILAGMAVVTALATIWPLLRASAARQPATQGEAAFYKAQIDEIERDVARGLLPRSEAEAVRAEAARRLIAAPSAESKPAPGAGRGTRLAAAAVSILLLAAAVPLYLTLGQPSAPDAPLASRADVNATKDIEVAIAGVEAHLLEKPDDGQGWAVLAPVYMRMGRYGDAAHAYAQALRLLGENADRRAALGEALMATAGGVVTGDARAAFEKALAEQPGNPQARYYLALGLEQEGKTAEAIAAYQALATDSPPDAAWRPMVESRVAALKSGNAPDAISDDQRPMIEGMVGRLAERLAGKGGEPAEWVRLIRAYAVLHQADKAKAALADARRALAPNAEAIAELDALARDLRLGDTP